MDCARKLDFASLCVGRFPTITKKPSAKHDFLTRDVSYHRFDIPRLAPKIRLNEAMDSV